MCAPSGQEQVSSQELIQFTEAVAELKGEGASSTSLIAKTIMKFNKRENDEKIITKEQFISQCVFSEKIF